MSLYHNLDLTLTILACFQENVVYFFYAFAKSFENLIVKQQISFFNTYHFTW